MADIYVTAHYGNSYYGGEYLGGSVPNISFGVISGLNGANLAPDDVVVVAAKDGRPSTSITGADGGEVAAVIAALAGSANSNKMKIAFSEMISKNVSLKISVLDSRPADMAPNEIARTTIQAQQLEGGRQEFTENSVVEIRVIASMLDAVGDPNSSFDKVIVHEFMHLLRDGPNNSFRQHGVGEIEWPDLDSFYSEMMSGFDASLYLNSSEIALTVTNPTPPVIFDPIKVTGTGTDGNNVVAIPDNPTMDTSPWAMVATIDVGAGNDFIQAGDDVSHSISMKSSGLKVVNNVQHGFQSILTDRSNVSGISLIQYGSDLYVDFDGGSNAANVTNGLFFRGYYHDFMDGVTVNAGTQILNLSTGNVIDWGSSAFDTSLPHNQGTSSSMYEYNYTPVEIV